MTQGLNSTLTYINKTDSDRYLYYQPPWQSCCIYCFIEEKDNQYTCYLTADDMLPKIKLLMYVRN